MPPKTARKAALDNSDLPPDWIRKESRSKHGKIYFTNVKTKQSQWHHPAKESITEESNDQVKDAPRRSKRNKQVDPSTPAFTSSSFKTKVPTKQTSALDFIPQVVVKKKMKNVKRKNILESSVDSDTSQPSQDYEVNKLSKSSKTVDDKVKRSKRTRNKSDNSKAPLSVSPEKEVSIKSAIPKISSENEKKSVKPTKRKLENSESNISKPQTSISTQSSKTKVSGINSVENTQSKSAKSKLDNLKNDPPLQITEGTNQDNNSSLPLEVFTRRQAAKHKFNKLKNQNNNAISPLESTKSKTKGKKLDKLGNSSLISSTISPKGHPLILDDDTIPPTVDTSSSETKSLTRENSMIVLDESLPETSVIDLCTPVAKRSKLSNNNESRLSGNHGDKSSNQSDAVIDLCSPSPETSAAKPRFSTISQIGVKKPGSYIQQRAASFRKKAVAARRQKKTEPTTASLPHFPAASVMKILTGSSEAPSRVNDAQPMKEAQKEQSKVLPHFPVASSININTDTSVTSSTTSLSTTSSSSHKEQSKLLPHFPAASIINSRSSSTDDVIVLDEELNLNQNEANDDNKQAFSKDDEVFEDMEIGEVLINLQTARRDSECFISESAIGELTCVVANNPSPIIIPDSPDNNRNNGNKILVLVVDTNILISCLSFIRDILTTELPRYGVPLLVLPWVVMQELDYIKDNKKHGRYAMATVQGAREAVRYIHEKLQERSHVVGQTPQEAYKKSDIPVNCNDDRILICCQQWKEKYPGGTVILLTADVNLSNKSLIMGVDSVNSQTFWQHLKLTKPKKLYGESIAATSQGPSAKNANSSQPKNKDNISALMDVVSQNANRNTLTNQQPNSLTNQQPNRLTNQQPNRLTNQQQCVELMDTAGSQGYNRQVRPWGQGLGQGHSNHHNLLNNYNKENVHPAFYQNQTQFNFNNLNSQWQNLNVNFNVSNSNRSVNSQVRSPWLNRNLMPVSRYRKMSRSRQRRLSHRSYLPYRR